MPLGLVSSEQVDDYWSQNTRRKVFYSYPNGTAPLTGLLSFGDNEETPQPQFGWNEERWLQVRTTTKAGATANTVFYIGGSTTTAGATFTPTAGTNYRIYVTAATLFQPDDVVAIHGLTINSSSVKTEATFLVTAVDYDNNFLETNSTVTSPGAIVNNAASVVGLAVIHMGSAYAEGSRSRTGQYTFPAEIINYTNIEKTPFEMTSTALKEPLKYDKTGAYSDQLKKAGIKHMAGMEWKSFFSNRRATTAVDPDTGATVRRSFTGGLLWFLKQWEKGNTSDGGAFDYRPAGDDISAQTDYLTYTKKRIIRLGGTSVTKSTFNRIEALPFQRTNSTEWCKVCFCGSNYLAMINEAYEKQVQVTQLRSETFKGWNFELTERQGLSGKIYYKNHPLFNETEMINSAFYVDLGYVGYRPLKDRDTDVMPMIQENDADKRKDQYLSEWGLEIHFPESHMYVEGLNGISVG